MVEKIEKIEFASTKKRGTLYETGSKYPAKDKYNKGVVKSQVFESI